jgi:hypothetical protein
MDIKLEYQNAVNSNDLEKAKYWLSKFEFIDPPFDRHIPDLFRKGKKVIATFDSTREPVEDELIVVYGNYPDWHYSMPFSSKMYRHITYFWDIIHDSVEYHPCWEKIDQIYIINLEKRRDRYVETLLELAKVQAPLHRMIHHKVVNNGENPTINCSRNNIHVINNFKESNKEFCLVLEDDFTFISDIQHVWKCLSLFFERTYDFEICLLATSKFHEKWEHDDLLTLSKQLCTCSSGYILSKNTVDSVLNICNEGFEKLELNSEMAYDFAFDQYWRRLTKRFFFKKKLGFQRVSLSNIGHVINSNLD